MNVEDANPEFDDTTTRIPSTTSIPPMQIQRDGPSIMAIGKVMGRLLTELVDVEHEERKCMNIWRHADFKLLSLTAYAERYIDECPGRGRNDVAHLDCSSRCVDDLCQRRSATSAERYMSWISGTKFFESGIQRATARVYSQPADEVFVVVALRHTDRWKQASATGKGAEGSQCVFVTKCVG